MKSLVAVVVLSVFSAIGMADDSEKPKLGKAFYPDAVRFVSSVSEDREVATMIFDNFSLATASGKASLVTAQTKSFSISNPVESKGDVVASLDVRGFLDLRDGGSAALIIHAGGETTVVDLKKAVIAETSKPRKTEDVLYSAAKENADTAGFRESSKSSGGANYLARVNVDVAKGQALQATLLLLVDRSTASGSAALITVDSLDVAVKAAPKAKSEEDSDQKTDVTKSEKAKPDKNPDVVNAAAKAEKKASAKKVGRRASAKKTAVEKTAGDEPAAEEPAAEKSEVEDPAPELMEDEPVASEQ